MINIDLQNCSAPWLSEQDDEALTSAILTLEALTPAVAAVLDQAFILRIVALMPRADDMVVRELESLDSLMWDAAERTSGSDGAMAYRDRWDALSRALRYRREALRQSNPLKNLEGFKWVREILEFLVRNGRSAPLSALKQGLRNDNGESIKDANLSRVLGLMEANLLITRQRMGNEKRVSLGSAAPTGLLSHGNSARPAANEGYAGASVFFEGAS
jgi:hypothetical protein